MKPHEFVDIRKKINKTQTELSALLGFSTRAIQSYEQGSRNIPVHVESHLYLLLARSKNEKNVLKSCWEIINCPPSKKNQCPVYELNAGTVCWMVNNSLCNGRVQSNWRMKMDYCNTCTVLTSMIKEN